MPRLLATLLLFVIFGPGLAAALVKWQLVTTYKYDRMVAFNRNSGRVQAMV